jgi:hypothetical protein
MILLLTTLTSTLLFYPYQMDERAKPGNLLTKWCSFFLHKYSISPFYPQFSLCSYYTTLLPNSLGLNPLKLKVAQITFKKLPYLKENTRRLHYKKIIFVYDLFNDAVSSSEYRPIASNDKMINGWWIRKYIEGSCSGLILGTILVFAYGY